MILGVDHIALSCEDIIHGAKLLEQIGYRVRFIEESLPNNSAKQPFLTVYDPLHSIAYCQSDRGVSLELTKHSVRLHDSASPYQVLFSNCPVGAVPFGADCMPASENIWRTTMGAQKPVAGIWSPFRAQFWYDAHYCTSSSTFVRALHVPVSNLSLSEKFWLRGLGCRLVNRSAAGDAYGWVRLVFRSPLQRWCLDVVLAESNEPKTIPYLDTQGFPCLALISTRLTEDKEAAQEMGACEVGEEFNLEVAENLLKIVILRGPDNELFELIEICKPTTRRV